ncbi:hypothetical protein VitviT2T_013295 [Vitis vinifera]|uniref:Uncharacterized protein n=1 Tax=Vitis vinifera TaxID=29760 RepID=A0ABY9CIB2_VITVI|nr:hypothetical protein VitviT2T_013295 [Vitis vinifera]
MSLVRFERKRRRAQVIERTVEEKLEQKRSFQGLRERESEAKVKFPSNEVKPRIHGFREELDGGGKCKIFREEKQREQKGKRVARSGVIGLVSVPVEVGGETGDSEAPVIVVEMPVSGSIEMQMVGDLNLLKPNRIFRTGGYFVWSTLPAYHKDEKDQYVWNAVFDVTKCTS